MTPRQQFDLIESFDTARPPNPIFCHQDFLEKLARHASDATGRRAGLLMQRLCVDERRQHYKPTHGVNRGWRRSRLGGNHGSHFYAWWAPRGAAPLNDAGDFASAPAGAIFLRDIRHHDDHSPLTPQSLNDHYLPVSVRELRREEYGPAPWTPQQSRFASARQAVRILKGHPGSGKTTALWHAADAAGAERVLYVTYSHDLAALARGYFDRYCSSHKRFHVVTLPALMRELLGEDVPVIAERDSRKRFIRDLTSFFRSLGVWADNQAGLYDEMHAHLAGDALPAAVGRFPACTQARVPDKEYQKRRSFHTGAAAAASLCELAGRLERLDPAPLADRYFPELALAWRVAALLRQPAKISSEWLAYDCIAVDECQDLTPIEAFVIVQLAACINRGRRVSVPLLVAGDEAQTVRPTDFEWGWLNDLLHAQVGTPSEFKLAANLRSPRRIAELVNRVWDLYSHIQKQERPGGTGLAEIDDDATDQIIYCTAAPGPELNELLGVLAAREGLALIALDEAVPDFVPEKLRPSFLTVSEAKGLDFHSVCVLDAGRQLDRVMRMDGWREGSDLAGIRRRLIIDRLRVALSRPTERLFWLDVNPTDQIVRQSLAFLNGGHEEHGVSSSIPAAVLTTLDEEQLDFEERVQRCQADARQYLGVKPEIAWSRAQQAVTFLGRPGSLAAVTDPAARDQAWLTLAEICFCLAFRNVKLAAELGRPDLFREARRGAIQAHRTGLARIIESVEHVQRATPQNRLSMLAELARAIPEHKDSMEPWLRVEIEPKTKAWIDELEAGMFNGHNAGVLIRILPPFYEALGLPDAAARTQSARRRAIQFLIRDKQFAAALAALRDLPEPQPGLEAVCHEGLGDFRAAAESHRAAGNLKEALNCCRSIPDLDAALALIGEIGNHPAAESLQWIAKLRSVIAERPEKFTKTVLPAEKKILEELLERSLGVTRKKPAPRKAPAARKRAAPRKRPEQSGSR